MGNPPPDYDCYLHNPSIRPYFFRVFFRGIGGVSTPELFREIVDENSLFRACFAIDLPERLLGSFFDKKTFSMANSMGKTYIFPHHFRLKSSNKISS